MAKNEVSILVTANDQASKTLDGVAKSAAKFGAITGAAITGALVASTKAAAQFEQQMTDVSTLISGDSTQAIAALKDGILELSKTVPKSPEELGASSYAIMSAGFTDAADALNVLRGSAKLATAGLGTTEEATSLLTVAMNAFGKDASQSEQVADILFKTVKNGITTVSDLSQSFGKMAGNAVAAGVDFESVQAATAALSAATGKTSESQNALAQVFVELTQKGSKLDKALSSNGGSIDELNKSIQSRGLVEGFEILRDQMGVTDTEFKNMFSSAEAGTAVFQLLTSANDTYHATALDMVEGLDAMAEAFDKQTKSAENQFKILRNQLNVAMIKLGYVILPVLVQAMSVLGDALSKVFGYIGDHRQDIEAFLSALTSIAKQVADYLGPKLLGLWSVIKEDLMPILKDLTENILIPLGTLFGLYLVGHIGLVIDTIKLLIQIFAGLYDFLTNNIQIITLTAAAFGGLAIAMNFSAIASAFQASIAGAMAASRVLVATNVALMQGSLMGLQASLVGFAGWGLFLAAALIAFQTIQNEINKLKAQIDANNKDIAKTGDYIGDYNRSLTKARDEGRISQAEFLRRSKAFSNSIQTPGNADGTKNFKGGLTIVGEKGPELVSLPTGSSIYSNQDSRDMAGNTTNINGNIMLGDSSAVDRFFERLQKQNELARFGV